MASGRAAGQHLARRPAGERRALAGQQLVDVALHRAHDQAVALDQPQRAGVGHEQRGRLRDDLAQHGGRVEVGGDQAADALQLLRAAAGAALGGQHLGALDGGGSGGRQVPGELEVLVRHGARLAPRHAEHGLRATRAARPDRHAERGAMTGLGHGVALGGRHAAVGRARRRRRWRVPRGRRARAARRSGRAARRGARRRRPPPRRIAEHGGRPRRPRRASPPARACRSGPRRSPGSRRAGARGGRAPGRGRGARTRWRRSARTRRGRARRPRPAARGRRPGRGR